jgi:hypothetical protein
MRPSAPNPRSARPARFARTTSVAADRSRRELEQLLDRYGAVDFLLVEDDANASIRFAIHGRYVQLLVPLPDRFGEQFVRTPFGKPRPLETLVTKGKLEALESGISAYDDPLVGTEAKRPSTAVVAGTRRPLLRKTRTTLSVVSRNRVMCRIWLLPPRIDRTVGSA